MISIKTISDEDTWENYYQPVPQSEKTFLSSYNWGEFCQKMGQDVWRLGIWKDDHLLGLAQFAKVKAKRGSHLLFSHSPHLKDWSYWPQLLEEIKKIAKKERVAFIRLSPYLPRTKENLTLFQKSGFLPSPIHTYAEYTWNLDLNQDPDSLLKNMRKTTRYCIRKAEREGIKITQSQDPKAIKLYLQLQEETVERHHYVPFSKNFLENQLVTFAKDHQASLFIAWYKNTPIAAAIVMFWQETSFYHHGASSLDYPKLQAPYLLQWKIILEAKKRGCTLHNFWGITESKDPKHPWAGVTLFKKGFSGYDYPILHSQDLPLSLFYCPIYLFEKLRRLKRGL